jgi:hypothetical protein
VRDCTTPSAGSVYQQDDLQAEVRRVRMPKTHNHVYNVVTASEILVLTVWGAPKGRGPRL